MALVHNASGHPIIGRKPAAEVVPGDRIVCSQRVAIVLSVVPHDPPHRHGTVVKWYLRAVELRTAVGSRWLSPDMEVVLFGPARED